MIGPVTGRRLFVLMGSGETSPTMIDIHRRVVGQLDPDRRDGVLLETPYAFQENVDSISTRAQKYFADSVGLEVTVAPPDDEAAAAAIRTAPWVFSGPGSPTFALSHWRDAPVQRALHERLRAGTGVTVLASAAAVTVGSFALPVYEIYKVGANPEWMPGLGLTEELGLDVAVIPHYDNTEGGTHDTRYCYLGERRLTMLEDELPPGAGVLGVDEHTAVEIDLDRESVVVLGRGRLVVRRAGHSTVFPSGSELTLATLRATLSGAAPPPPAPPTQPPPSTAPAAAGTLVEVTREAEARFVAALDRRDAAGMVEAILELESAIRDWSADTEEDEGTDLARDVLRGLVTRLGEAATVGLRDPDDVVRPLVQPMLTLRDDLRDAASYEIADRIRDILTAANVEVHDTEGGTTWTATS
jgi:hypothetical protein